MDFFTVSFQEIEHMNKKLKILIIIFFIIVIVASAGLVYISYYNKVLHPFSGFNKEVLVSYEKNEKIECKDFFEEFFIKFVNYTQYEEKYSTDFYYNYRDLLCPVISTLFFRESDAVEGFSYIIKPDVEYESLKERLLDNIAFVTTPIGDTYPYRVDEYCYYIESIEVNGWVFKEIYFNYCKFEPSYFEKIPRRPACWLAYNDNKKEISFSYFYENTLGYYIDEECLTEYIKVCLYL